MAVKWQSRCDFVFRFTNDLVHLFMCFLATCVSPSKKCLIEFFACVYIEWFVFLFSISFKF